MERSCSVVRAGDAMIIIKVGGCSSVVRAGDTTIIKHGVGWLSGHSRGHRDYYSGWRVVVQWSEWGDTMIIIKDGVGWLSCQSRDTVIIIKDGEGWMP